jgi:hypothetical protein
MKHDREDLQNDYRERVQRFQDEKTVLEGKHEKKRREFKDLEASSTKEKNERERENAVAIEKLNNQIIKAESETSQTLEEIEKVRLENNDLKASLQGDKSVLQEQLEKLREEYNELDGNYSEVANKYDRELELWKGKNNFVEQQRDTAKKEVEDI